MEKGYKKRKCFYNLECITEGQEPSFYFYRSLIIGNNCWKYMIIIMVLLESKYIRKWKLDLQHNSLNTQLHNDNFSHRLMRTLVWGIGFISITAKFWIKHVPILYYFYTPISLKFIHLCLCEASKSLQAKYCCIVIAWDFNIILVAMIYMTINGWNWRLAARAVNKMLTISITLYDTLQKIKSDCLDTR